MVNTKHHLSTYAILTPGDSIPDDIVSSLVIRTQDLGSHVLVLC